MKIPKGWVRDNHGLSYPGRHVAPSDSIGYFDSRVFSQTSETLFLERALPSEILAVAWCEAMCAANDAFNKEHGL